MFSYLPLRQTVDKNRDTTLAATHRASWVTVGAALITSLLASCSTPPKPPTVDESTKRPVNARAAVDLKACQSDLSRASIVAAEMARAGVQSAALNKALPLAGPPVVARSGAQAASLPDAMADARPDAQPVNPLACSPAAVALDAAGNTVVVVPFGVGSAAWGIEPADAAALVRRGEAAAVILIRGRTDASADSMQETALARRRAESAAAFFRQAGVPKDKLRLTWQGAGDPPTGLRPSERGDRAHSRRVEIEFYAASPVLLSLRSGAAAGKGTITANL